MKKLQQTLVVGALLVAPFVLSTTASAATCQAGYTGPDSNNLCVSVATYTCEITNDTTVTVVNDNTQIAVSGDASTGGNTGGGGAQSGSATNDNGVTFNATVENGTCSVVATVPATPEPAPQPAPEPQKQPVAAPVKPAPAVLATTAADSTVTLVASILGVTAAGLVALKLAATFIGRK